MTPIDARTPDARSPVETTTGRTARRPVAAILHPTAGGATTVLAVPMFGKFPTCTGD
jgi:hypothetical protein